MSWRIIVHGGAHPIAAHEEASNREGTLQALRAGIAILSRGGAALDAVEAAIVELENNPTFNAGRGAAANALGEVELSAAIMDGHDLSIGALASFRVFNPIKVARRLLPEAPVFLVGEGASAFAQRHGFERPPSAALLTKETKAMSDTVGCVAMDGGGHIVSGVSTGGLPGVLPGRIGDSPMPGCGYYADNAVGGVSLSGDGEYIARATLAALAMRELARGVPVALAACLSGLARVGGEAGVIAINAKGEVGWDHNGSHFAVALATDERAPEAYVSKHA